MRDKSSSYPHVIGFLQRVCSRCSVWVHAARMRVLQATVFAVIRGGSLAFSNMGRALPGQPKAGIKRVDRLLSNSKVLRELPLFYGEIAARLLTGTERPIVLIDWTKAVEGFYALSATIPLEGRSVPLYNEVHPEKKLGNRRVQLDFLKKLARVLPAGCRPILCFDAGFGSHFCDAIVRKHEWDFVSRIRGNRSIRRENEKQWIAGTSLYEQTSAKVRDFGRWLVCRRGVTAPYRIVGIKAPRSRGRKQHPRRKQPRSGAERSAKKCAKDPWILFSSLFEEKDANIIFIYRKRMQIEETFRDLKNLRFGWSLRHVSCNSQHRLQVLFLIASLGMLAVLLVGRLAEGVGRHLQYQSNTIRTRRVISFFVLGKMILAREDVDWLEQHSLTDELDDVHDYISHESAFATC
jgi:hypothetical protein